MTSFGLETDVVDRAVRDRAVERFRSAGIALPTFAQLADPGAVPASVATRLAGVDPDDPDAANLFRVHWFNGIDRAARAEVPGHLVMPSAVTGVDATIVRRVRRPLPDDRRPQGAGCVRLPRAARRHGPVRPHRSIAPSGRRPETMHAGGVAISRIMGCRGVAVLPENMSRERFEWLDAWVTDPADIIRTPGSESNVKEIYDACARARS